jgi:hypothetical protein
MKLNWKFIKHVCRAAVYFSNFNLEKSAMYLQKCIKMQICTGYYSADFALLFLSIAFTVVTCSCPIIIFLFG